MAATDDAETELRIMLMRADLDNKNADTELKRAQTQWEPWKAISTAFGTGMAVASGLIAAGVWLAGHLR